MKLKFLFYRLFQKKNFSKINIFSFFSIIFVFTIDRLTKSKIIENQLNNGSIFINDYLNFELIWNSGIGFGLLNLEANLAYHLISLLIFAVIMIIFVFMIKSEKYESFYFSLILGGASGNFYDRITYFSVPDFIDFHINNYHWFTFNVADIFISVGIILIIIKEIVLKNEKN
jgi:signal peptidase II